MAGAKKLVTLGFILVPAGAVHPAGVCSRHYIASHRGACRGGYKRGGRGGRASRLEVLFEASANVVVKIGSVRVSALYRPPLRLGEYPSFYRPRRRQFTIVPHCFIYMWRYGLQCRGVDRRPGDSCFWRDVMAHPVSVQEWLRGW
jgi:hypothetical protein